MFTENDVLAHLERANLKFRNGSRYLLAQCPLHEDTQPSCQIYKDDWFVNCHAGCGRFHISKAFPELIGGQTVFSLVKRTKPTPQYKDYDLMDRWRIMQRIPKDHKFKNLPLEILNGLGWRWDVVENSYFIPYFSARKDKIPFAQWRHLSGERRFTMLKNAKPIPYGLWNLTNDRVYVVEGTSDAAILECCGVAWVALPSASSITLMRDLALYAQRKNIKLIYAGDNDVAGESLRAAIEGVTNDYSVHQPPEKYKDWGDFFVAEGRTRVEIYLNSTV